MLKQYLTDYCHDVLAGEVVACRKHKWACQRFLRDIDRQDTDDFPYIFDEDKAARFFEWMHLFKHTKGVLQGHNIVPHDIQLFIFGNIYGWVHRYTGYRRFRRAYWQVARKNAKSQSLASVSSYEAFAFGVGMSEVYCTATKKDQAKIVWDEIDAMLGACEELQGKYTVSYGVIRHTKSRSTIKALSKEDRKKGDGTNPQCGIVDEYHLHETDDMYNVLKTGMVARPQPLLMVITTAGKNLNSPCYRIEYDYVSKLLDPDNPIEAETYFAMVNELDRDADGNLIDSIEDETAWAKANPILCSYPEGVESLRADMKDALEKPEVMDDFLTKNMNVWIQQQEKAYMRMDKWAACGNKDFPDLRGMVGYAGLDLSKRIDLTSVGFIFPMDDGRFFVWSHSFLPEETLRAKESTDKVPYSLWARQGWLTVTPGAVVDYAFVQQYLVDQIAKHGWKVKEICYDNWSAGLIAQELDAKGFTMVEIIQGMKTLSEPTKHFRELVYTGKLVHNQNPVLTWAIGNAVTRQDVNENIMLDKDKSTNRIDPIAAMINAHVRARLKPEKKKSIYTERGAFTL